MESLGGDFPTATGKGWPHQGPHKPSARILKLRVGQVAPLPFPPPSSPGWAADRLWSFGPTPALMTGPRIQAQGLFSASHIPLSARGLWCLQGPCPFSAWPNPLSWSFEAQQEAPLQLEHPRLSLPRVPAPFPEYLLNLQSGPQGHAPRSAPSLFCLASLNRRGKLPKDKGPA